MRIAGCDPGVQGGVAVIDTDHCTLQVIDMPVELMSKSRYLTCPSDLAELFSAWTVDHLFVEEVGVRQGEGAVGAFSFGRGLGRIEGVAAAQALSVWLVRPQVWKAQLNVPAEKARAVARAKQLLPKCHAQFLGPRGGVKDGRAEAALIALYGCLKLGRTPAKPLVPLVE